MSTDSTVSSTWVISACWRSSELSLTYCQVNHGLAGLVRGEYWTRGVHERCTVRKATRGRYP